MNELLGLMDTKIELPERTVDKPFMMSVEGTYQIPGRGTVVTGTVDTGKVKIGEEIDIVGYSAKSTKTIITGIETFRQQLDYAEAGDNVGLLLRGVTRDDVRRGIRHSLFILFLPDSLLLSFRSGSLQAWFSRAFQEG